MTKGENQNENAAFLWREDPSRPAGFRRTLAIGDAEYGFCWIPAGEFDMGSPESEEGRDPVEVLHHVTLTRGFWALETPTTQALYKEIVGKNPSGFKGDDLPVEEVSWDEATKFCETLTRRLPEGVKASLPTEAQWEYACRAGTTTPFWFGSALNGDKANCSGNYPYGTNKKGERLEKTSPVKSYAPNPWGLYDMHGNVWEWTSDYYDVYPTGAAVDPKGPDEFRCDRVIRGGSWRSAAWLCRSADRQGGSYRINNVGFRFLLICD